jgi:hypothetical protein
MVEARLRHILEDLQLYKRFHREPVIASAVGLRAAANKSLRAEPSATGPSAVTETGDTGTASRKRPSGCHIEAELVCLQSKIRILEAAMGREDEVNKADDPRILAIRSRGDSMLFSFGLNLQDYPDRA